MTNRALRVAFIVVIGVVLCTLQTTSAAVDLTGNYKIRVALAFGPPAIYCLGSIVQSGTGLSMSGACDYVGPLSVVGTVDPDTGAFALSGQGSAVCTVPGSLTFSGAGDGTTLTGTASCLPSYSGLAFIGSTTCGNGALDAGEQCDDQNLEDGDCCSSSCQFDASGSTCLDGDNDPCTDGGVCNGAGGCVDLPADAGTPCADDGNLCTGDFCNGAFACIHPNNGLPCNDANPCTTNDQCAGGTCGGTPAVTGAPCSDDFNLCTDDVCNGAGTCVHSPNAAPCDDGNSCTTNDTCGGGSCVSGTPLAPGAPCFDGDLCTTGDTCDNAATCMPGAAVTCDACSDACLPDYGCVALDIPDCGGTPIEPSAKLTIQSRVPDDKDAVTWSWGKGQATAVVDFGDPVSATNYRFCAYAFLDEVFTPIPLYQILTVYQTLAVAELPAGSGWAMVPKGFKYKGTGIKAVLKSGDAGKARITFKGKGASLAVPASLTPYSVDSEYYPAIVQLRGDGDRCWGAQFDSFDKHTSQLIKMKDGR